MTKESYQENQEKLEENGRREQELKGQIEAAAAQAMNPGRGAGSGSEAGFRNWKMMTGGRRAVYPSLKNFHPNMRPYLEERNELERCEKKAASLSEQKAVCRESRWSSFRRRLHTP